MSESLPQHSLKYRYLTKLVLTVAGIPLGLVIQAIAPRMLGPGSYGNFSFLNDSFRQFISFLDCGTSNGFFVSLSKRDSESSLKRFYWGLALIQTIVLAILVWCTFAFGMYSIIWIGQPRIYIVMAAALGVLTWYSQTLMRMADAYGITVKAEIARLLQKLIGVGLLTVIAMLGLLTLASYFLFGYVMALILIVGQWAVLRNHGISIVPSERLSGQVVRSRGRQFYEFSSPIFLANLTGLIFGFMDRWMLQRFGGSVQQGFFGLANQISMVGILFAGALTPLLMREFARSHAKQDLKTMRQLFERYVPVLYLVSAYFSIFIAVEADKVTVMFGGQHYGAARAAVVLMALVPMHQTYGQLSGSLFLASGRTRVYSAISIVMMFVGLFLSYWLLAPRNYLGLDLGSEGLAIKTVVMQAIAVNAQLWFNTRMLGMRYKRFLFHQIGSACILGLLALASRWLVDSIAVGTAVRFVGSGVIYTMMCVIAVIVFPKIALLRRDDFRNLFRLEKYRSVG